MYESTANGHAQTPSGDGWPGLGAPLIEWAAAWHNHGFRPIPLHPKKKKPIHDEWPTIPFHENLPLYFGNSHGDNTPGKHVEDRNALAFKHLVQVCRLLLDGDEVHAEQLAAALAERYGF